MYYWRHFPCSALWYIDLRERPLTNLFFYVTHILMWVLMYAVALTMDFAELVGLKQVWVFSGKGKGTFKFNLFNSTKMCDYLTKMDDYS